MPKDLLIPSTYCYYGLPMQLTWKHQPFCAYFCNFIWSDSLSECRPFHTNISFFLVKPTNIILWAIYSLKTYLPCGVSWCIKIDKKYSTKLHCSIFHWQSTEGQNMVGVLDAFGGMCMLITYYQCMKSILQCVGEKLSIVYGRMTNDIFYNLKKKFLFIFVFPL